MLAQVPSGFNIDPQSLNERYDSFLRESDSIATIKNTRIAQRTKIIRARTEME